MLLKNKPVVYSFLEMLTTKYVILLISDVLIGRLKQLKQWKKLVKLRKILF